MSYISNEIPVMSTFDTFDPFAFPVKMVNHLEQEQVQSYKEAFDSFDSNHNGRVSSSHLQVKPYRIISKNKTYTIYIESHEKSWGQSYRHRGHGNN